MIAPRSSTVTPILVFAFKRPEHLRRLIASLQRNPEAVTMPLHVYCDGARNVEDAAVVEQVRHLVDSITGFASTTRHSATSNKGLAGSVIAGINEMLATHERVIVLEDDLVVSPFFLRYMIDGLDHYIDVGSVASIHGYAYPVDRPLEETYFLRGADCWGWATWRRGWHHFDSDGSHLLEQLKARDLCRKFDLDGAYPYTGMLEDQIDGRNSSWAIRWHASCFLRGLLTLYPRQSLVQNIGGDDSGTHSGSTSDYDVTLSERPIVVGNIQVAESTEATRAVADFFRRKRALPRRVANRVRRLFAVRATM